MQTTIRSALIRQCRFGVHLVERNRNFILTNTHIYDGSDTGVFMDDCNLHQAILCGNHISYNKRAGIRQFNGDVHNIQITGNDIEYNSGHDADTTGEIVLEAPDNVTSEYTIAGNTLQATRPARGANILIVGKAETPGFSVRLVTITGNVVGSREMSIAITNGVRISITGNTIYGGTAACVSLRNCNTTVVGSNTVGSRPANYPSDTRDGLLLEDCVGCTVIGNIINDCRFGDPAHGGAITARRSTELAICSCQVFDPQHRGIHLHDSSRCRISDNTVTDRRDTPTMRAAIEVSGTGRDNVVQNNAVSQGTESAIDCPNQLGHTAHNTIWQ